MRTHVTTTASAKKRTRYTYASFWLALISMPLTSVNAFGVMSTGPAGRRRRLSSAAPPKTTTTTSPQASTSPKMSFARGNSAVARPYARGTQEEVVDLAADWSTNKAAAVAAMSGKTSSSATTVANKRSPLKKRTTRSSSLSSSTTTKTGMRRPAHQGARIVKPSTMKSGRASEKKASKKKGLTREEEIQYSFQLRTLRAAMRLRDQLIAEGHTPENSPTTASVSSSQIDLDPSLQFDQTWANACGTSVVDLQRLLQEGQTARTAMCSANVGLVTAMAKRHHASLQKATTAGGGVGTILTMQDLIQEGNLGLMEAAERFEPERNIRFSTYATWWIRQRMLRSIADSSRIIRLPAHVHGMLSKMSKTKSALHATLGRPPTDEELAQDLSVSVTQLRKYADSSRNVVSLELPVGTSSFKMDRRTLGDSLASQAPSPEEAAVAQSLQRDVQHVLAGLSERERQVLELRFGLTPASSSPSTTGRAARTDPLTVAETAACMEMTRDRVRVLEARALNKLRHPQRNYRLKEYVTSSSSVSSTTASLRRIRTTPPGCATLRRHPSVGGGRVAIKTERSSKAKNAAKTVRILSPSSSSLPTNSALFPFSEQDDDADADANDDDLEEESIPSRQERLWFF